MEATSFETGMRGWLVVGAPMDGSGTGRGERAAPRALRDAGLLDAIAATDFGDLDIEVTDPARDARTGVTGFAEVLQASRLVRDCVSSTLAAGWRPLVLGGCCSILPGVLAGVRHRLGPFRLAFVDGHLDIFDGASSRTGEAAGMALAIATGGGPPELAGLASVDAIVDPTDVVAIGDADGPRRRAFEAPGSAEMLPGARIVDAAEILGIGVDGVARELADAVAASVEPLWLHLDLDVVDMGERPAATYPVATGLGWEHVRALLAPLVAAPALVGMTVAGLNSDLDRDGGVARRVADLLGELLSSPEGAR